MGVIGIHGAQIEYFMNSPYPSAILATEDGNAAGEALKQAFKELSSQEEYKDILFYHVRVATATATQRARTDATYPMLIVTNGKEFLQVYHAVRTKDEMVNALDPVINPQEYLAIPVEDLISIGDEIQIDGMCHCDECRRRRKAETGYSIN